MIPNKALKELDRICGLVAFNVSGAYAREKINQHATRYLFNDGSKLIIKHTLRIGNAQKSSKI